MRGGQYIGFYCTKAEALAALERLAGQDLTEIYNSTLQQVFDSWRSERWPDLTAKGREMYENAWKRLAPLADRKMRDLKTADYQKIINDMGEEGLSVSAAQKIKQLVGQLSKWAMREDIIATNYAQFIRIYQESKASRESFSDAEIKRLQAAAGSETVKLILLLIYTGMRIGELFALKIADIHFDAGYLQGGSKTAAGKNRIIPILPESRPLLEYFCAASPGPRLIDGYSGNRTANNFRRRDYYKAMEELGIEGKSPHSTRHTFASLAVRAGVAPESLKEIIGHADYSTTVEIYTHADLPTLQEELCKMSKVLNPQKK